MNISGEDKKFVTCLLICVFREKPDQTFMELHLLLCPSTTSCLQHLLTEVFDVNNLDTIE